MSRYFKKECPRTPLFTPVGRPVTFEHIDDDYGYMATDDGWMIGQMEEAMARRIGGVIEITGEEYEEWLKKKVGSPSLRMPRQRESIGPKRNRGNVLAQAVEPAATNQTFSATGNPVSGVATPQKGDGLKVQKSFVKPRLRKISDLPTDT